MHITENLVPDLKDLGKNQLIGLGFAVTGYVVAYSVTKAFAWFFNRGNAAQTASERKINQKRVMTYQLIAAFLGVEVCILLANKSYLRSPATHPRVLDLHVVAFALASFGDQTKMIRAAIGLSAASVLLRPAYLGAIGAALGGHGDDIQLF